MKRALADELAAAQDAEPVKGPKLRRGKALKRCEAPTFPCFKTIASIRALLQGRRPSSPIGYPGAKGQSQSRRDSQSHPASCCRFRPPKPEQPGHSGDASWSGWYDWGGQSEYGGRGWGYWYGQPYGNYWDQWSYRHGLITPRVAGAVC